MKFEKVDKIDITTATSTEEIFNNIKVSIAQPHKEIYEIDSWRIKMPIALVGGGPSLKGELDKLKRYRFIMVCGSAHDYVVENNIIPTWCIVCDPDPLVNKYMKLKNKNVKYLVASQCSQETFKYLEDQQVYIWHAGCDEFGENVKIFGEAKPIIPGGCTVGTRAMCMAISFGFNYQHLFGFDTCVSVEKREDGELIKHHAYKFQTEEETIGNLLDLQLGPDSPTFKVAGYMVAQLFDFKNVLRTYADTINVEVFGDGLLKYLIEYGRDQADIKLNEEDYGSAK